MAKSYNTDQTNPSALTSNNETITITGGAVVSIENVGDTVTAADGYTTATFGAGTVDIQDGTFRLKNTSTVVGFRFRLSSSSVSIQSSAGRGVFDVQGNWIVIGTSDGTSGFRARHWDIQADYIPCVWVETGSGTGIYEKYLNVSGYQAAHTATMANAGAGKYGKFFAQNGPGTVTTNGTTAIVGTNTQFTKLTVGDRIYIANAAYTIATITDDTHMTTGATVATQTNVTYITNCAWFGDGTNGKIPPNGAKIRVPNIILTHNAAINTSTVITLATPKLTVLLDTVQFSRSNPGSGNTALCKKYDARRVSYACLGVSGWGPNGFGQYFEDCGFSPMGVDTSTMMLLGQTGVVCRGFTFKNCSAWYYGTNRIMSIANYGDITIDGGEWYNLNTASIASVSTIYGDATAKLIIKGGATLGGVIGCDGTHDIDTVEMIDMPVGEGNTTARYHFRLAGTGKIRNVTIPSGYGAYGGFLSTTGVLVNWSVIGVTCASSRLGYILSNTTTQNSTNWYWANFNFSAGTRVGGNGASSLNVYGFTVQNIRNATYGSAAWVSLFASYVDIGSMKGIADTSTPSSCSRFDHFAWEAYQDATTMKLWIVFGVPVTMTQYATLSAKTKLNQNGDVYLGGTGEYLIWEIPYTVKGVTSFQNVNPSTTANCTMEYAIDVGSGYSDWKTLDGATLSAETVDKDVGFKMKFRFTSTSGTVQLNSNKYVTCNVDQTVMYPTAKATLAISGLKTGSEIRLYQNGTTAEITGIESTSGSTFSYDYDYYGTPQLVDLVVMHTNYQYIRYEGLSLGATGLSVPIQQQLDRQYLNP